MPESTTTWVPRAPLVAQAVPILRLERWMPQTRSRISNAGETVGSAVGAESAFGGGGGTSAFGGGGLGGLGGLFGGGGGLNNLFNGGANQGSSQHVIRTRLRSAVSVAPLNPAAVQQKATVRLRSIPAVNNNFSRVNVNVQGRSAVMTGVVGSDRERRMSELLLRLEPGVRDVENRVTVSP